MYLSDDKVVFFLSVVQHWFSVQEPNGVRNVHCSCCVVERNDWCHNTLQSMGLPSRWPLGADWNHSGKCVLVGLFLFEGSTIFERDSPPKSRICISRFRIQCVDRYFDVVLLGSQPLVLLHGGLGKFQRIIVFCLRCFTQLSISSFQCCRSGPFRFSGLSICNPMSFQCASSHHCTHLGMRFLRYWNHLNTKLWRSLCSTVLGAYANIFLHCLGCLSFGL